MNEEFELLRRVLTEDTDIHNASSRIHSLIARSTDPSSVLPVQRAIDCLRDHKYLDFCGHLRQCLVYKKGFLEVSKGILEILEPNRELFGFTFHHDDYKNTVNIEPVMMKGTPDLQSRFHLEKRKARPVSAGDGELRRNYGYSSYLSLKQKLLMYLIKNQEKNETILACLPTGGGKSLAWELPALSGRLGGMAIVVVPTVALAQDQEKRSAEAFDGAFGAGRPAAYYGKLTDEEKRTILKDIASGQISILYISPEALLQKQFKATVLEAAKKGYIGMLVIDEAHLTVQWGRHFRPEFQLLSSLRDQLQEASPSGIKTLLLSATLTQDDTNVLKNVFSSELFTEFRGDELRTEPVFYTHECESEQERTDIIRHLVALAPRPIILYVATLDQARDYNELLRNEGYRNCACFTGDTADEKKADLLESWRQNKLDIMVATSAFGMGVDKADIRTIITAYIPESISRYYQEVGRAGRDGYASINYWLPFIQEDQAVVHHLTKSAVLTEELLAVRWSSLLHAGTHDAPDEIWLNMYHAPEHLKYSYTGEKNKNWNIDTVLFMSRCKLIDILDTVSTGKDDYRILVRLLQIPVLIDTDTLISYISQYRESERHMIEESMAHVRDMIHNPDQFCYADYFVQDFPYSASQCSGCPACRAMGTEPYYSENIPEMHTTKKALYHRKAIPSDDLLPSYLQYRDEILLVTDHTVDEKAVNDCIALLIRHAVNIIIYPPGLNLKSLINRLAQVKESNYLLLTLEEADSIPPQWLDGCCALFYTKDSFYNQRLYAFHNAYLKANKNAKVVHIAPPDTYVPSRKKQLIETVDCSITFASIF